jgi:hypothetical protein
MKPPKPREISELFQRAEEISEYIPIQKFPLLPHFLVGAKLLKG